MYYALLFIRSANSSRRSLSSSACRTSCCTCTPAPAPTPPSAGAAFSLMACCTTSCHVVPLRPSSSAISSFMRLQTPTPSYPNAVYICTNDAPALANASASAPDAIPPQPMMGVCAGRRLRRPRTAASARGCNGGPESPPCSVRFAAGR